MMIGMTSLGVALADSISILVVGHGLSAYVKSVSARLGAILKMNARAATLPRLEMQLVCS